MLKHTPTGTWIPAYVPESPLVVLVLLLFCSVVQSATNGYDGSMTNGLNILPSYYEYFELTPEILGLQTASVFIGSFVAAPFSGYVTDRLGRRPAIFWGSVVTLLGVILQASAQNTAMFTVARAILGGGTVFTGVGGAIYLTETVQSKHRAWALGLLNNFYAIGAIIAAGATYGTSQWTSTWAWRAPSLLQGIFSILAIVILPFLPESPRWLVHIGKLDEARLSLARVGTRGDIDHPDVILAYKEIVDTLTFEEEQNRTTSPRDLVKDKQTIRRLLIGLSVAVFSTSAGNLIAGYYLGAELATAGITDPVQQLKANIVLNVFCFGCALIGTQLVSKWGRRPTILLTQFLCGAFLFIVGGLSKKYADNPEGASHSLIYGNVACIFLFQGSYSIGWTPLTILYPPEIFSYSMRSQGMAVWQAVFSAVTTMLVFTLPIGIAKLGYKLYMINGGWNLVFLVVIFFTWVETQGKTLEEIEAIFHSDAPSSLTVLEAARKDASADVAGVVRHIEDDQVREDEGKQQIA